MLGSSRITTVEQIYYQSRDTEPFVIDNRVSRDGEISEQPYVRWCTSTSIWQPLDLGWISKKLGLLVLLNNGKHPLELAFSEFTKRKWIIPPGEIFRGIPNVCDLVVRSDSEVLFTVYALPN